jgi:uncharacterized protein (DUF4415 family)
MNERNITKVKVIDGRAYKVETDGSMYPLEGRSDWARLSTQTDADIEAAIASDPTAAPIADETWFSRVRRTRLHKEHISIKLDGDVLAFFRAKGGGYQTRINDVLRAFMEHEARAEGAGQHGYAVREDFAYPSSAEPSPQRSLAEDSPPKQKKFRRARP